MSIQFSHRNIVDIVFIFTIGLSLAFALPWLAKSVTAVFEPGLLHYLPQVKR